MKDKNSTKKQDALGKPSVKDDKKLSSSVSNPQIRKIAEAYMKSKGLDLAHPKMTFDVSPERGARIAKAYEEMKHDPENPEVKKAYDALINETADQWKAIKKTGLKVSKIKPNMVNPYPGGSKDVIKDIAENKHLWYFPTEQGYGSTEVKDHPLLQPVKVDDEEMPANDLFRIVHDYFGHAKEGEGFGPKGEENAWLNHKQMYSPEAQRALTSETRGQNSWVNFGPMGEENRANPGATTFAEQKAGLLPDWVLDELPTTGREKMADGGFVPILKENYGKKRKYFADGGGVEPAPDLYAIPGQEPTRNPATTPSPEGTPSPTGEPEKPLATTITREYAPIWDVQSPTPKLVQLPHNEVNEKLKSGNYSFDKQADVPLIAPDGEVGTVKGTEVDNLLAQGFSYATPKQVADYSTAPVLSKPSRLPKGWAAELCPLRCSVVQRGFLVSSQKQSLAVKRQGMQELPVKLWGSWLRCS